MTLLELLGKGRSPRISGARFMLWTEMRRLGCSYPEIGREVGRDHSTVMSGVRKYMSGGK